MKLVNSIANLLSCTILLGILYGLYKLSFHPIPSSAMKVIATGGISTYLRFMNPNVSLLTDIIFLWSFLDFVYVMVITL